MSLRPSHASHSVQEASTSSATSSSKHTPPSGNTNDDTIIARRTASARSLWMIVFPAAVIIRTICSYALHALDLHSIVASRLELTNSLVSFRSVRESLGNLQRPEQFGGPLSPYAGLTGSHAPPLVLWIWSALLQVPWNSAVMPQGASAFFAKEHLALLGAFIVLDLLAAWAVYQICTFPSIRPSTIVPRVLWMSQLHTLASTPLIAASVLLLNPFSVAACVIFNQGCIAQVLIGFMLLCALRKKILSTMILLAISAYLDMYPLLLLVPMVLLLHKQLYTGKKDQYGQVYAQYDPERYIDQSKTHYIDSSPASTPEDQRDFQAYNHAFGGDGSERVLKVAYQPIALPDDIDEAEEKDGCRSNERERLNEWSVVLTKRERKARWNLLPMILAVGVFGVTLGFLFYLSFLLSGSSWSFLASSYGYSLTLPSLNPTYSLFWYFFTSIFERFHGFFLGIFHGHLFVYLIPLTLRFWEEPLFLSTVFLHLSALFKPYPVLPEVFFTTILLLGINWSILQPMMRRIYPIGFLHIVSLFTLTLMQYLWLDSPSGNANFFFFQNLLYLFSQLFMTMECIGAVRRLQSLIMEGRIKETNRLRKIWMDGSRTKDAKDALPGKKGQ